MESVSIYQDYSRAQNLFSGFSGSKVANIASSNTSFKPFYKMKLKSDKENDKCFNLSRL